MKIHSLIDFLGFIVVKIFSIFLCCVPLHLALWIGRRGGDLVYLVNSKRRSIAYANLKSAFPEKESAEIKRIVKSHFENLGMSVVELLKLPIMEKRYLDNYVSLTNSDRIEEALKRGKGVILLAAHFGNWEMASLAVGIKGYRMSVFAREQKYTRLNNLLNKYREMTGCKVITKGFSVREIIKNLHNNGMVAMLADQDAGSNGVFVDFLGRPASTAQGAVNFGLKTGAVILPTFIRRITYDRHLIEIGEPLRLTDTKDKEKDIRINLENIRDILEDYIRKFPEQWLWSHKRWKSSSQRTILILSDGKAGHFNQSMAVAEMAKEALGSRLKARGIEEKAIIKIHVVVLKFKSKFRRILLDLASFFAGSRCQGNLRWLRFCLTKDTFNEVKNRYADIVISCGTSLVGANIFLAYENNAKGIVIMKPGFTRGRKFDLVILPRHDEPKRISSNMLIIEAAPNRIVDGLKAGGSRLKGVGLLIGGDAKNFKLRKEAVEKVLEGILKMANEIELELLVSTSRRTPAEIDKLVKEKLSSHKRCRLLVIANENNKEGVVQEIFDQSEVIVVSPESISMISEAASSGRHVVVFIEQQPMEHQPTRVPEHQNKYEKVIKNLEDKGYIKTASSREVYDVVKRILIEKPDVKKLEHREKIVKRLEAIV